MFYYQSHDEFREHLTKILSKLGVYLFLENVKKHRSEMILMRKAKGSKFIQEPQPIFLIEKLAEQWSSTPMDALFYASVL